MFHDRRFLRAVPSWAVVMGWLAYSVPGQAVGEVAPVGGSEHAFIRAEGGVLSVKIVGVPLDEVLRVLAAKSESRLVVHGSRSERVSSEFDSLPLEEGLRRLIKENFVFLYSPDGQLQEVHISSLSPRFFPASRDIPGEDALSGEGTALDNLIARLKSGDAEERKRAVRELGELKDERAIEAVIWALDGDEDPHVRKEAIWALEDLGGRRAGTALAAAVMGDRDESVRQRAVAAVAKIGEDVAVEPLTLALRHDPDRLVRYVALVSLVEIGEDSVSILREALNDPDELIWAKADELLTVIRNEGVNAGSPVGK